MPKVLYKLVFRAWGVLQRVTQVGEGDSEGVVESLVHCLVVLWEWEDAICCWFVELLLRDKDLKSLTQVALDACNVDWIS